MSGRRLFVAINRGQLERLSDALRERPELQLKGIIAAVVGGLRLRVRWSEEEVKRLGDVVAIDLSLQETGISELLDKACLAAPPGDPCTAKAFHAARDTLSQPSARERLDSALRAVQLSGHHLTMRDLWSFVSHLLTGGIADPPQRSITLDDHVGCRLFSGQAQAAGVPIIGLIAKYADPAREAWPIVTRRLLLGEGGYIRHPLGGAEQDQGAPQPSAADVVRAMWVDGTAPLDRWLPDVQDTKYAKIREAALRRPSEWLDDERMCGTILRWLAELAGDPVASGDKRLPAWRRLAYEDRFRDVAPAVASEEIDAQRLRLGIPSPSPAAREALGERALVPFVWFAEPDSQDSARLRLTPRLLAAVEARQRAPGQRSADPRTPELVALRHWLVRLPTTELQDKVLVFDQRGTSLEFEKDVFSEVVRVEVKAKAGGEG